MTLAEDKQAVRIRARAARDALDPGQRAGSSQAASDRVLALAAQHAWTALYSAIGSEMDPSSLEASLQQAGALLAFPRIEGQELVFRRATSGSLVPGGFGLAEPPLTAPRIAPLSLDLVLVPGLAFSAATGHRVGYGKGYFDRALGAMLSDSERPLFVGFAFEAQIEPTVPAGPMDIPVDVLVTESRTLLCTDFARDRRL